jgi:hypothetical protein
MRNGPSLRRDRLKLRAGGQRSWILRLGFRKWNDLRAIHLVHGMSDFRRVMLSGKSIEEIAKENQGASKGEETYGEKHKRESLPGNRISMFPGWLLPQWADLLNQ